MEQQIKIENLEQLFDWIEWRDCYVLDKAEDNFFIEAPNNVFWQVLFDKDDKIEDIISKTIKQLEEFDADENFSEYWSAYFAKQNNFTPLHFITILKKGEEIFRELARELKKEHTLKH